MATTLIDRLSALSTQFVAWKQAAVDSWNDLPHAVRLAASPSSRASMLYDLTIDRAKLYSGPMSLDIREDGRERLLIVDDGIDGPIAVWFKQLRKNGLLTSNNWTRRTRRLRDTCTLYDTEGQPGLVICGHTLHVDKVMGTVMLDEVMYTQEKIHGREAGMRTAVVLGRIYSSERGVLPLVGEPTLPLFAETPAPVVKVKVRRPAAATGTDATPSVGVDRAAKGAGDDRRSTGKSETA